MMKRNPIQFAAVREDPQIEAELVRNLGVHRVLLIGSGGCTALSLQAEFPELEITVVDPNPAQLSLLGRKVEALATPDRALRNRLFNVGSGDPQGLNACGNFESLFRSLQYFLEDFVLPREEWLEIFEPGSRSGELREEALQSKFWPVAFDLHFHDSLLRAIFGEAAIQHAPPNSYPRYFQALFERGLRAPHAPDNYFLHHVFLGFYLDRERALPRYLQLPVPDHRYRQVLATLDGVESFGDFDLLSLSNIFDWMGEAEIAACGKKLSAQVRPGACVVFRQLGHHKDFTRYLPGFRFDAVLASTLFQRDRSLFYSKLNIAFHL